MIHFRSALIGVGLALLTTVAFAQARAERLAFEVASVKADSAPFTGGSAGFRPGGMFVANIPAAYLVNMAFSTATNPLFPDQIVGLPDWAKVARYNVTAKVPANEASNLSPERGAAFVRSLLEDRFGLKTHMETRELPVYIVTVAPGGPKIHQTKLDCSKPEDAPKCGIDFNVGHVSGPETVANLVGSIAGAVQRPALDHTNLEGRFDVDLKWNATNASDSDQPSIFVAVQEQLGLKLEPDHAALPVLVIDHIERPTEN